MSTTQTALESSAELRSKMLGMYYQLCDQRDAVYAKAAPIEAQLAEASLRVQDAKAVETALAEQVEAIWGPNWFDLKREISRLAASIGRIPPRE